VKGQLQHPSLAGYKETLEVVINCTLGIKLLTWYWLRLTDQLRASHCKLWRAQASLAHLW